MLNNVLMVLAIVSMLLSIFILSYLFIDYLSFAKKYNKELEEWKINPKEAKEWEKNLKGMGIFKNDIH